MDTLLKEVENLIIDKTLSLDAIQVINRIKEEHRLLTEEVQVLRKEQQYNKNIISEKDNIIINLENTISKRDLIIDSYKIREQSFIDSEHSIKLLKKDTECSDRIVNEVKEVVSLMFKNPLIRKTIKGSGPQGWHDETEEIQEI